MECSFNLTYSLILGSLPLSFPPISFLDPPRPSRSTLASVCLLDPTAALRSHRNFRNRHAGRSLNERP